MTQYKPGRLMTLNLYLYNIVVIYRQLLPYLLFIYIVSKNPKYLTPIRLLDDRLTPRLVDLVFCLK